MFAHLHAHTTYSLLDGYGAPSAFAPLAIERGQTALAITDHGTISGYVAHADACKAAGIAPVFGVEFYLVGDMTAKRGDRNHVVALAIDSEGYANLRRLVTRSHLEGFYRKPRIDVVTLAEHSAGLAIMTACVRGAIPQAILAGEGRAEAEKWFELFGPRLFFEIMPLDFDEQRKVNLGLVEIARELGVEVVATNDVHYPSKADASSQDLLLAVGTGKKLDDPDRFRFKHGGLYLKTEDEMRADFRRYHPDIDPKDVDRALNFAGDLAFSFNVDPLASRAHLPTFPLPAGFESPIEYLRHLCRIGYVEREFDEAAPATQHAVAERVAYELDVIGSKGFADYFLICWDAIKFAHERGIAIGPGRGSAAGSLVAYLLGVTGIDPLRYRLSFERFLPPHRNDYPDIDIDVEDARRDEIRAHLEGKYGADCIANVATLNAIRFKQSIRDAARVHDVPQYEVNQALAAIGDAVDEDEGEEVTIDLEAGVARGGGPFAEFRAKYPAVISAADALRGQLRAGGVHAAGIVIADRPLVETTAIELRSKAPVVSLTKYECERLGLVKFDLLGLKKMTVIAEAIRSINARRGLALTVAGIMEQPDDEKTFDEFSAGRTACVFQFNKRGGRRLCEQIKPRSIEDLATINALDRPGPLDSGATELFLERRAGKEVVPRIHATYDAITAESYGLPIYQEQVMSVCRDLAGMTWEQVHRIRKIISLKLDESEFEPYERAFVDGATSRGCNERAARRIFESFRKWAGYAFNRSIDIDQEVLTIEGDKPAGKIVPGEIIFVPGVLGLEPAPVLNVWDHGEIEAYEAEFEGGEKVVCSLEHRFLTEDGIKPLWRIVREGNKVAAARMSKAGGVGLPRVQEEFSNATRQRFASKGVSAVLKGTPQTSRGYYTKGNGRSSGGVCAKPIGNCQTDIAARGHSIRACGTPCIMAKKESEKNAGNFCQMPSRKSIAGFGIEIRGHDCVAISECEARFSGTMRSEVETGRFCFAGPLDRSRWSFPFPSDLWTRSSRSIMGTRRDVESGIRASWDRPCSHRIGLFHDERNDSSEIQGYDSSRDQGETAGPYLYRRLVSIKPVGSRPMVDLEVHAPHLFALANGIISHNSHAVAYALIGYVSAFLKTHYPLEYLCAEAQHGTNAEDAIREAKRFGVSVVAPDVNRSGFGWSIVDDVIAAGFSSVKGIGEAAAKAIVEARGDEPFQDILSFLSRTPRQPVHKGIVERLVRLGAFRSVHRNTAAVVAFLPAALEFREKGRGLFDDAALLPDDLSGRDTRTAREIFKAEVELLPFVTQRAEDCYPEVIAAIHKSYGRRVPISRLVQDGIEKRHEEQRIIVGTLARIERERADPGGRKRSASLLIEDSSGDILLKANPYSFDDDLQRLADVGNGSAIVACASAVSERTAELREVALLEHFATALEGRAAETPCEENLRENPGLEAANLRPPGARTLKAAKRLRRVHVSGIMVRVWSTNTRGGDGPEMGFCELRDETGLGFVLIWPDSWEWYRGRLTEGGIYEAKLGRTRDGTLCCDTGKGHGFNRLDEADPEPDPENDIGDSPDLGEDIPF